MKDSKRIEIDYDQPDQAVVDDAATVLRNGGIVVAPTETQYGLLCNAHSHAAIERLFELKARPRSLPMAVFVSSIDELADYGTVNPAAAALAAQFLPGPLTLVIEAKPHYPEPPALQGRIGLRVSPASIIQKLCAAVDFPLSATSANRTNEPTPATAVEIENLFGDEVDRYLDAGRCDRVASTVVDTTASPPRILREGAVTRADIERVTKEM